MTFRVRQGYWHQCFSAVQCDTYDFLLAFHCNFISIWYHFKDIIAYFPKFKRVTWPWTHLGVIYRAYASTHHNQSPCQIWIV